MFGDVHINKNGETQPAGERLRELMEEIKLMDETGLDFYGIGEHHRPDYAVSAPEIILAAASTITKNIKLSKYAQLIAFIILEIKYSTTHAILSKLTPVQ